jgi:phosphonate transport system substrate-binding protein
MTRRSFLKGMGLFCASITIVNILGSCQPTVESNTNNQSNQIETLTFGILSTESEANQKPVWDPFLQAMSSELGITVQPFYADQYSNLIEAMRSNQIQIAWYGGKAYIDAAKVAEAEAFALTISDEKEKGYYAHLITNKNNTFLAEAKQIGGDQYVIKNAKNLTFAFNDLGSTSGFLVPSYYIFAKNKLNPNKIFKQLSFLGDHEKTALAVANQQVDIATNNSEALVRFAKSNPQEREKIEIIWTSPLIPNDPIAYRKDLPEKTKEKIRQFFYSYKDTNVLKPLEWSGFEPAADSTWNPIRELNIAQQMLDIENNANIKPEVKTTMLEELNKQLQELNKR